ncbi:hypothetical protein ABFY60_15415 [Lysinibacillus pakistanensis]|uniref:hypothetical protein n=1 Tax=Lysinibacillus pakistanensis TaxID=759811 RepID=UPI003D2C811E
MLQVIQYEERQTVNIEFDLYIPINIEIGTWNISKEPTLYWRTGDFKKSLIEIGVGKYTGKIRSITLTLCENVYNTENLNFKDINFIEGLPIFQIEESIDKTYIDEKGKLNIYIGNDKVLILFSENEIISIAQNDNVGFAIDNNKMVCGIIISSMVEHEKKLLKDALK